MNLGELNEPGFDPLPTFAPLPNPGGRGFYLGKKKGPRLWLAGALSLPWERKEDGDAEPHLPSTYFAASAQALAQLVSARRFAASALAFSSS